MRLNTWEHFNKSRSCFCKSGIFLVVTFSCNVQEMFSLHKWVKPHIMRLASGNLVLASEIRPANSHYAYQCWLLFLTMLCSNCFFFIQLDGPMKHLKIDLAMKDTQTQISMEQLISYIVTPKDYLQLLSNINCYLLQRDKWIKMGVERRGFNNSRVAGRTTHL